MLLIMFLIIFSAIALRNIRHGVYLITFSMPLYLWRFSVFGIPSTALEAMIYILFLVWVINKLNFTHTSRSKQTPVRLCLVKNITAGFKKNAMLNTGIILLFLGVMISTFVSSDTKTSLGILKSWFFDPFLFFLVLISVIKTKDQIVSSLAAWLFSGIAVSIAGIFYLLNNDLAFDRRLSAFFLSPNHLAMYISPAFLISSTFLLHKINSKGIKKLEIGNLEIRKYLNYKLQITVLLIIFIPLYFTHSYGAFLGISAGLFYMLGKGIFRRSQSKKKKSYLVAALIILSFGVVLGYGKMGQIENSSGRSSFHSRLMIWNTAAEIIKDNPLFGIGPGTFQDVYLSYAGRFSKPYLEWAVPQPHNIFLAFYLQTGLIGFVGFILILVWFFQRRRHYRISPTGNDINNNPISNQINDIIISLMIYILVHGLVDATYWKNDLALMFWTVVGLNLTTFEMYAKLPSCNKDSSNLKTK